MQSFILFILCIHNYFRFCHTSFWHVAKSLAVSNCSCSLSFRTHWTSPTHPVRLRHQILLAIRGHALCWRWNNASRGWRAIRACEPFHIVVAVATLRRNSSKLKTCWSNFSLFLLSYDLNSRIWIPADTVLKTELVVTLWSSSILLPSGS